MTKATVWGIYKLYINSLYCFGSPAELAMFHCPLPTLTGYKKQTQKTKRNRTDLASFGNTQLSGSTKDNVGERKMKDTKSLLAINTHTFQYHTVKSTPRKSMGALKATSAVSSYSEVLKNTQKINN